MARDKLVIDTLMLISVKTGLTRFQRYALAWHEEGSAISNIMAKRVPELVLPTTQYTLTLTSSQYVISIFQKTPNATSSFRTWFADINSIRGSNLDVEQYLQPALGTFG